MANDTPREYQNWVIYEVYVRNHSQQGTFLQVEADLPRIKALGVDVVWFMPIHPIGQVSRKGSLGCPYSIADYRGINPEYGTCADFARLIQRAHELGMKVMIDVVYNHTAHDSELVREHPDWFHQDKSGRPVTTVPEWSDVIDLKHGNPELTAYLIDTLRGWAQFGVDGFRCDVASLVPQEFWVEARREVAKVKPGVAWLAESVHAAFVAYRRFMGLPTLSDSELYAAFDMTYVYDIWPIWQAAATGRVPVGRYLEMLRFQDAIYPGNYAKMRYVENHDQARIMAMAKSRQQALAWTAFEAFNKGPFLIYGGQESAARHTPSLFDKDPVKWGGYELAPFLSRLAALKKDPAQLEGKFVLAAAEPAIQAAWVRPGGSLYGVFNVSGSRGQVEVQLPDGRYVDELGGPAVEVSGGQMSMSESAAIVRCRAGLELRPFYSDLLDLNIDRD